MEVRFIKVHPDAKAPVKVYSDDSGWDLFSVEEIFLPSNRRVEVSFGIAIQLPVEPGYIWEAQIRPRSLHRSRGILVTLGTIDQGYRGELKAVVYNFGDDYVIRKGDRIVQLVVLRFPRTTFVEVDSLSSSDRGEKGFESSGR